VEDPGSEKVWRTDQIEPTYVIDDPLRPSESVHGWRLGGKYSLEEKYLPPLVAWCEFVPPRYSGGRPMLATFHLYEFSTFGGELQAWKILEPAADGQVLTEQVDRNHRHLYFDRAEYMALGDNAAPLSDLVAAAQARAEERDAAYQRQRDQDPYIGMLEEVSDVLWARSEPAERDEGRRELREMFDRLPRDVLTELAVRLAYDYFEAEDRLQTLQAKLEEAD